MADVKLISILLPQTVSGTQAALGSQSGASNAGAVLSALPPGTILSGFIVNRDASGNPVLRTASGDVVFQTNFFLKIGSEVVIRVENSPSAGTLAHLLTVNGQPPAVAEAQSSFQQEPEVLLSQNLAASKPVSGQPVLQPSVTVTGTLLTPAVSATTGGTPPALPTGSQLVLKVVTLVTPPSIPTVQNNVTTPASAPFTGPAGNIVPAPALSIPAAATPLIDATLTLATSIAAVATFPGVDVDIPLGSSVTLTPATTPGAPSTPLTAGTTPQAAASPVADKAAVIAVAIPSTTAPATANTAATPLPVTASAATLPPSQPQNTASIVPQAPVSPAPPVTQTPTTTAVLPQPGSQVTATVIASERGGHILVQTPAGLLRLPSAVPLPVGSKLTLEIMQVTPAPLAAAAPAALSTQPAPLAELATQWTSLQQVFNLLSERNASLGLHFVQGDMPWLPSSGAAVSAHPTIPSQGISAGLMMFVTALRGNDFRNWLGKNNVQWLEERGHGELVARAAGEFSSLSRQFSEAQPQHWQALFFPVAVAGEVQQARLFVKRDRKQGGSKQQRPDEDTRFVVEVEMSQLGEIQMDGFIRRREKEVQFDLVIRSMVALSAEMQKDIMQLYNDTGALTGYKGGLMFQAVKEFPVNPMEEIVARKRGTVVV